MSKFNQINHLQGTEVAVIGMSCRMPKSKDLDDFWQNLQNGNECISFFSDEELLHSEVDFDLINKPNYVKARAILNDVEYFDASFFGFTPREAEITDPQQRIFLECAWEALENAGYNSEIFDGLIGVYAGIGTNSYYLRNIFSSQEMLSLISEFQISIGNNNDFLSTRVSYKLNLRGPSMNIQTACSTSLVTVHAACQSLLNRECDMALAGGAKIFFPQVAGYLYEKGGVTSPDGHCRAFDSEAQGFVHGNGVGVVILRRLEDALVDGDYIYAVIKGSAINNDGSLKIGFTAPGVRGQAEVIAEAQAMAGIEPDTITYVETHGTGTELGDPIEIAALTQAFCDNTNRKGFCAIGSVKTNIGHLDTAAGIAGFIKTVLSLKHQKIPPSLYFKKHNTNIDFNSSPFYMNDKLTDWDTDGIPRRAGVSSFGIGGTNAHIILEEAPPRVSSKKNRPWELLVISAKTNGALDAMTLNLAKHLEQHSHINLADVAFTLSIGRRAYNHRRMLVCKDTDEAINLLKICNSQRVFSKNQEKEGQSVSFMFPGQGAQYVNMALELYQFEPIFREQVDLCSEILRSFIKIDLRDVLYPEKKRTKEAEYQLKQTAIAQPALFVIEYALSKLWIEWGIRPQAMIGHSIGEYVAACLSGVFSLEDALSIVTRRGQLIQQLPGGVMLAIPLAEYEVQSLLGEEISLSAINGPSQSVVSGSAEAVSKLREHLTKQNVECLPLYTSHAFHSKMMDPILELFIENVKKIKLKPPQIPIVSTVTGEWATESEITDPVYWGRNLRQTVRFDQGLRQLLKEPDQILLEVGPGQTLSRLSKRHPNIARQQIVLSSLPHAQKSDSDIECLVTALGTLWLSGVQIDWSGFYRREKLHRLPLPTYPFERRRYWIDPPKHHVRNQDIKLNKKPDIADWFYIPSWERSDFIKKNSSKKSDRLTLLVFMDRFGFGSKLIKKLKTEGHDILSVLIGSKFTKINDKVYEINPKVENDYDALFNELKVCEKIFSAIIHLLCITENTVKESRVEFFDYIQNLGLYSLLNMAKAIEKNQFTDDIRMHVFTNNMQEVTGDDTLFPEKATVLGPVKIIPLEYLNLNCQSIDIILPKTGSSQEEMLINHLVEEFVQKSSDPVVAYRGNYRWVPIVKSIRLEKSEEVDTRLRHKGVYLITGGFGGMGFSIAEYLAKSFKAKLILVGRSQFPDRSDWKQWLVTHDEKNEISQKIRKMKKLEEFGAEVIYFSVDVSNDKQMSEVIESAQMKFARINGVIHTAGIADYAGIIQNRSSEITERILSPKVKGTLVLDRNLKDLDFFVLFSSIGNILYKSKFGQVAYNAANEFLDAFAYYKTFKDNTHTVAINWDDWKDVGMSVDAAKKRLSKNDNQNVDYRSILKYGLSTSEGIDIFCRILTTSVPQVIISTCDLPTRLDKKTKLEIMHKMYDSKEDRLTEDKVLDLIHSKTDLKKIEKLLQSHSSVTESVVVKTNGNNRELIAFIVCNESVSTLTLRNLLRKNVPDHMIPNQFIQIDTIPMISSDEIDYVSLLSLGNCTEKNKLKDSSPRSFFEKMIGEIWVDVLGVKNVGPYDNFIDLGGDSLAGVQATALILKKLNIRIPFGEWYNQTLKQIAARCEEKFLENTNSK